MKAYILGSYSASGLKGVIASGYAGRREAIDKLVFIAGYGYT